MKSATKYEVPIDLLEHLVHNAFSSKPVRISELKEGYFNAAYLIELSSGKRAVLKVAPRDSERILRYEKNIMYAEVHVMQMIKHHTNVPIPNMYYYDAAKTSCESEYFFMEHIDAPSYDRVYDELTREERMAIDEKLGEYDAAVNRIKGHRFGYCGQERRRKRTWFEAFSRMLEDILADAKYYRVDFGFDETAFFEMLENDKPYFDEITEPSLVHWDLWGGNVFVRNKTIVGIIDWERALWADPLIEYGFRTKVRNEAFLRGYGHSPDFTPSEQKRIYWYDLYLYMTMVVEYYARAYTEHAFYDEAWKNYCEALECLKRYESHPVLTSN